MLSLNGILVYVVLLDFQDLSFCGRTLGICSVTIFFSKLIFYWSEENTLEMFTVGHLNYILRQVKTKYTRKAVLSKDPRDVFTFCNMARNPKRVSSVII